MTRARLGGPAVALVLMGLLAALFAPTAAWLARTWQVHPYYGHGWLVPGVAAAFAWRARARFAQGEPADAGLALVAAGVAAHLAAARWQLYPVSASALVVVLAGLAWALGGRPALRAAAFPATLLLLAVPWPFVEHTAPFLAAGVARASAAAAGGLGAAVVQHGAELSVTDGAFTVGAPCSGLQSAVALITLAAVLAGVLDGPWRRRMALVLLALPLALAANWLRLTGLLWIADAHGSAQGLAWFHGPPALLLYAAAAAGLVAAGRWLGCDVRGASYGDA
ncbi:hypothetical protein DCC79_13070 [bacterium]|nr:MAG: hypothetical protein DCC79_13070 [bacterium]